MNTPEVTALVLAAGKGTRMKSELPKVMHVLAGKPLVGHVLDTLSALDLSRTLIVVGHGREHVETYVNMVGTDRNGYGLVVQAEQRGTGHAVQQALPYLDDDGTLLVVSGDQPLFQSSTLRMLIETHRDTGAAATILTAKRTDPFGYGRIIRRSGAVVGIVEEKDADAEVKAIQEVNTGTYCFHIGALRRSLDRIQPANAQGEYYLTDVIGVLALDQAPIASHMTSDPREAVGINDRFQLSQAEEAFWERKRKFWMAEGVTMVHPSSILIDADVVLEPDVVLQPYTWLKGQTRIGRGSVIGPQTTLTSCTCGRDCVIEHTVGREAVVGDRCHIGPFSHLRPGTVLEAGVHIGNFENGVQKRKK